MMEGIFKGWVPDKGYGFISQVDKGPDVFVLKRNVDYHPKWAKGSRVEFSSDSIEGGLSAYAGKIIKERKSDDTLAPTNTLEAHPDFPNKRLGRVKFWNDFKNFGFVEPEDRSMDLFMCSNNLANTDFGLPQAGDRIEFNTAKSDRGPVAVDPKLVGFVDTGNPFFDIVENRNTCWKEELANLAEEENWNLSADYQQGTLPLLDNYIRYTFHRLAETNGLRVSADGMVMAFNTGLVTYHQESIFGVCLLNPSNTGRKWILARFVKEFDSEFVRKFGANLPPLAEYFDDPAELLFDRRLQLFINIDHIMDNLSRFPVYLRGEEFMARQLIESARLQTEKRVYRNYKTAIPHYYRERGREGRLQLLLPVFLNNPSSPDLALTVSKNEDGSAYLSSTVLTLDMAYCNARLLSKPDTEWLRS